MRKPELREPYNELMMNDRVELFKFVKELRNSMVYLPQFENEVKRFIAKKSHLYPKVSKKRKTIIFDMDETLIKAVYKRYQIPEFDYQLYIPY